jgi:Arc/MetJ-type ribon-helix-helix transcriptional regulator
MQTLSITLPDQLSDYVKERLNGRLEEMSDYVAQLILKDKQHSVEAVNQLRELLDEDEANEMQEVSFAEIRQNARVKLGL